MVPVLRALPLELTLSERVRNTEDLAPLRSAGDTGLATAGGELLQEGAAAAAASSAATTLLGLFSSFETFPYAE